LEAKVKNCVKVTLNPLKECVAVFLSNGLSSKKILVDWGKVERGENSKFF
jgi:hypothetical protein